MSESLNCPLVLASTSPRRIELLNQAGLKPLIINPMADETVKRGESPKAMVQRLAKLKAESVMEQVLREYGIGIIIGADTTVVAPDGKKILGKPRDRNEAIQMLTKLSGKTHTVFTGYCIIAAAREMTPDIRVKVVATKVKMRPLTKPAIERYVDRGESMDKAGAYAAQGRGMGLIESVSGSYANVIGLPISQVLSDLEKQFEIET